MVEYVKASKGSRALQLQVKAHCLALPSVSINLMYWQGN